MVVGTQEIVPYYLSGFGVGEQSSYYYYYCYY